jgi:restriction endonuclease Mrr
MPPATLGNATRQVVFGVLGGALELIGDLTGANEAYYEQERKGIEDDTREFDGFLRKVPQIRVERARLAEEERQRAELEEKKRQEELRLLRKQARTVAGLKRMNPTNFELAVASLYLTLGYNVYVTPYSGDQGIDLVAVKDKERIAVQCKRYKRLVPVGQVRDFYGSFVGTYTRGIFVTSSTFSRATRN